MSSEPPPHKRGRRKYQSKQEYRQDQIIQQLGRRFQHKPAAPSTVEEIPLPSETPFGAPPRLTEKDYKTNFMKDPPVVSSHSGALIRSNRNVVKAQEAEVYMLNRSSTTPSTVLAEFESRILNPVKRKRALQASIPYVDFPCHSIASRQPKKGDGESESNSDDSQDSGESDSSDLEDVSDGEKRKERKKARMKRKIEEKERQASLLRQSVDRKRTHPNVLHPDVSYNEYNLGNDGPECRCPPSIQKKGIKHGYYAGEDKVINCSSSLYHYVLQVTPHPNTDQFFKTQMMVNGDVFTFEAFSLVTHSPLPDTMTRRPITKYGMFYEFQLVEERIPDDCFCAKDCDAMFSYIFHEIFELFNFSLRPKHLPDSETTCPIVHIMPRFECAKGNYTLLWSSKTVLAYFLQKGEIPDIFSYQDVENYCRMDEETFNRTTNRFRQAIILNTERKPSAMRADWFERDVHRKEMYFVHNSFRTSMYTTATSSKMSNLEAMLAQMNQEKKKTGILNPKHEEVKEELIRLKKEAKDSRILKLRESVAGYIDTGLKPDVIAHVSMVVVACHHIRYNFSISEIEQLIEYQFNDRRVLELAFIHSSMRSNYGTPSDHIKNMVINCGYRRKYGTEEKREKKKVPGIVSLFNIMGGSTSGVAPILHNERLEYLGDAVVELIVSHHLFFMLTHHFEGGLATYRTSLVQNRNLAKLAKNCRIDEMLQYSHGADLINEADFKHALANAFEALMAAVYLDGGLGPCDVIFSKAMYGSDEELKKIWDHHNDHELKREDPLGDRELSQITPALSSFHKLEKSLGIQFNNIRLLAKAFTRRNVPNNDLTRGHNQRLEWLGDSVLQLIVSDYLFKHYPNHHEGHMSLLRTSLVSNQTQSVVCDDLGFAEYVIKPPYKVPELKVKDKADLVEAFIGALYVDSGIEHCTAFVRLVFCPRLKHFIESEQWNDAKSHLQQWCLALRKSRNEPPAMPEYRVLSMEGPTNNRQFKIAVYFRNKRLSTAVGSNMHKAQLKAAEAALKELQMTSSSESSGRNQSRKRRNFRRT